MLWHALADNVIHPLVPGLDTIHPYYCPSLGASFLFFFFFSPLSPPSQSFPSACGNVDGVASSNFASCQVSVFTTQKKWFIVLKKTNCPCLSHVKRMLESTFHSFNCACANQICARSQTLPVGDYNSDHIIVSYTGDPTLCKHDINVFLRCNILVLIIPLCSGL